MLALAEIVGDVEEVEALLVGVLLRTEGNAVLAEVDGRLMEVSRCSHSRSQGSRTRTTGASSGVDEEGDASILQRDRRREGRRGKNPRGRESR